MKISMTGQEIPLNTGDCLIEVTAWADLITFVFLGFTYAT